MAYLALLQPDPRVAARISGALSARHALVTADSWRELAKLLTRGGVDGVVVDADHPRRGRAVGWIRRLRLRFPDLAIVAYADFRGEEQELYRFGGLGVDGVLVASRFGSDPPARVAVDRAVAAARASRVARLLEDTHGAFGSRAVAWTIEHAPDNPSPAEMAEALGHTTHTLAGELRAAGLPPAGRLMLWGRLLMAGAYMGKDRHTVEEAAYMVGYAAANSLSRAMKRETGVPPAEVARRGGLSFVHKALFGETAAGGPGALQSPATTTT